MSLISSLSSVLGTKEDNRVGAMSLYELDSAGTIITDTFRSFQYFPETINDSRSVNWIEKNVVGGSHPIYQWTYGSARTIEFEVVFTNEVAPPPASSAPSNASTLEGAGTFVSSLAKNPVGTILSVATNSSSYPNYSVDIPSAIAWLRAKTYPSYRQPTKSTASSTPAVSGLSQIFALEGITEQPAPQPKSTVGNAGNGVANAPPKLLLVMPNSGVVSQAYGSIVDSIPCIMTTCNITYEAFFRTGSPRIVTVSLGFAEIIQTGNKNWKFVDRYDIQDNYPDYKYQNTNFEKAQTKYISPGKIAPNTNLFIAPNQVFR